MDRELIISRRRFLQSLAAVGVAVACGPTAAPSATPSAGASAAAKPITIEWWRRNYTPGSQTAETVTSDAAVAGYPRRYPNVTINIQRGPVGPDADQKVEHPIPQQKAG